MSEKGYRQDSLPKKRNLTEKAKEALEAIVKLVEESEEDDQD